MPGDQQTAEHTSQCFACGRSLYQPPDIVSNLDSRPKLSDFGQCRVEAMARSRAEQLQSTVSKLDMARLYAAFGLEAISVISGVLALVASFVVILDVATLNWQQQNAVALILYTAAMVIAKKVSGVVKPEVMKV